MAVNPPRPSSTVILLREISAQSGADSLEVFLLKRHGRSKFLGGAHVFPGGAVDPGDHGSGDQALADGIPAAVQHFPDLDSRESIAYHLAAIRETFEEAGILFARGPRGKFVSFENIDVRRKFEAYRAAIQRHDITIGEVLRKEGLRFALDALHPYAHWVTPKFEGHRFDTRFFVAALPPGQTAEHDRQETVEGGWWTPRDALTAYVRGDIDLAPPTIYTLEELTPFSTVKDVVVMAANRSIVRIEPKIIPDGEAYFLVLPGDPLFPVALDETVSGPTRFVRVEGRWHMR